MLDTGYVGDPLRPDTLTVTPPEVVARLTKRQREQRVRWLIRQAYDIVDWAWEQNHDVHQIAAKCVLFSGGNDSTILAHLFNNHVDYAVHCNTTIGIEETRQFVRDTCKDFDVELIERIAPVSYRKLVLGQHISSTGKRPYPGGFPGPQAHFLMYSRLKERSLEAIRSEIVTRPRRERVINIAGRRRSESSRRAQVALADRRGSMVFASPLAMWTKLDMNTYRLMMGDVPVNQVSETLHMSGECLCGAFAHENELEEIRFWYPATAAEIDSLQDEVRAAGFEWPYNTWGHGKGKFAKKTGLLCSSCELRTEGGEAISI